MNFRLELSAVFCKASFSVLETTTIICLTRATSQIVNLMPITRKEFEKSSLNLEEEIVAFLNAHRDKAYTSDEIINATNLRADFDLDATTRISVFVVANFVAILHDLVAKGKIRRKVVNNRMYFIAVDAR